MSSLPTIPSIQAGNLDAGFSTDPLGAHLSASLTFDRCNARPIWVYVVPKKGHIWRLIDPLSPLERLPVVKEWTEKVKKTIPQWKQRQVTIPGRPEQRIPGRQVTRQVTATARHFRVPTFFKFDEPGRNIPVGDRRAYKDPSSVDQAIAQLQTELDTPINDSEGQRVTELEKRVLMFAHADMCNTFKYNHSLSDRRAQQISVDMEVRIANLNVQQVSICGDFNPEDGPNGHELNAEKDKTGISSNDPDGGDRGNQTNRRVELFVLPDFTDPAKSKLKEILRQAHDATVPELTSGFDWPADEFPCKRGDIKPCRQLMDPFDSPRDPAGATLADTGPTSRRHQHLSVPGVPEGTGPSFRQCIFYKHFTRLVRQQQNYDLGSRTQQEPDQVIPGTPDQVQTITEPAPPKVIEELEGEYHPPEGEHYAYYMDDMVKTGVPAGPVFPARVDVAPNNRNILTDFNLIRPSQLQLVKMDLGFWGNEREEDTSRIAGFRREPKRYFGLVEGTMVYLCYFETPEVAGFVKGCAEDFDKDISPLCKRLADAVRAANPNFRILIMAKAAAQDGPPDTRLNIFFPDMHLPRKFEEQDPVYSTDPCIHRVHMVKSMILHQLKRDYRLPAEQTPWLCKLDRRLCRDFFEQGAPRLKLPHWVDRYDPALDPNVVSIPALTLPGQAAPPPTRLAVPHFDSARRFNNPAEAEGGNILDKALDAAKKALMFLMQVGYYMFEFTQDDYRRMARKYPDNFPEKGYGLTKDVLYNWFYGFNSDQNQPPGRRGGIGEELKAMTPSIIKEVADEHFGTSLSPDPGRPPAREALSPNPDGSRPTPQQLLAAVDPQPARDLLRLLNIIGQQRFPIQVFHTGDLYELWANRRYLFEDFELADDADPPPAPPKMQLPTMPKKVMPAEGDDSIAGFGDLPWGPLKFAVRGFLREMLGGINAKEPDLWFRREANKRTPDGPMEGEVSYNIDNVRDTFSLPTFAAPTGGGVGFQTVNPLTTPTVDYTRIQVPQFQKSNERGKNYVAAEMRRRMAQVEAFEAPLRTDANGSQEDRQLLGGALARSGNGLWNKAVIDGFKRLRTKFLYGNHDCFRGVPRPDMFDGASPYHSEPGMWVEHGHRYEDSNVDGQPFGSWLTNLAYEIQELPFGEGILDEFALHREQSQYQPGLVQWLLLVEFGLDKLPGFVNRPPEVPEVHRFRIAVSGHTHQPDLVVAQVVFKERESSEIAKVGPFSLNAESIVNIGGGLLKGILFAQRIKRWWDAWTERNGPQKIWSDIGGNTINWAVDFAGLAGCLKKAEEFLKSKLGDTRNKLEREWNQMKDSAVQTVRDNARNVGLPPP